MEILFLSDLHLSPARPQQLILFQRLLRGPARRADAIYLLGDLFEQFWVGNDEHTPPVPEVLAEMRACAAAGPKCHVLRGNRELLLDPGFETLTGWKLLPDRVTVDIFGRRTLLMHGDLLCTRDLKYQMFRRFVEMPLLRRLFLSLPYAGRALLSHGLRPLMRRDAAAKLPQIVDVDPGTVRREMEMAGVDALIHGHTHRPGTHFIDLAGGKGTRIVLGDWYRVGEMLVCRADTWRLVPVADFVEESGG
jgi:UDP-2,3-diacylglucosamine hydrolase